MILLNLDFNELYQLNDAKIDLYFSTLFKSTVNVIIFLIRKIYSTKIYLS